MDSGCCQVDERAAGTRMGLMTTSESPRYPAAEQAGHTSGSASGLGAGPRSDADWPVQATRSIVQVVDTVRDKTSGPATTAVAGVVYGLVALMGVTVLTVVLVAATVRGLELLLWQKVWAAYTVLAVVTLVGGLLCWSRRATVPR
jgi:hypothetical protein